MYACVSVHAQLWAKVQVGTSCSATICAQAGISHIYTLHIAAQPFLFSSFLTLHVGILGIVDLKKVYIFDPV